MKFAHTFSETLSSENFPPEWQAAAIQYRQLKKCIKRLQGELAELGLSVGALKSLICECRDQACSDGENGGRGPMLQYMFDGNLQSFQPKLVLTIRGNDRLQLDLGLTEETRKSLELLLQQRALQSGRRASTVSEDSSIAESEDSDMSETLPSAVWPDDATDAPVRTIEILLGSDTEFFHILTSELEALDTVQTRAAKVIQNEIVVLGDSVVAVAAPKILAMKRSDLYPWREIFRVYMEMGIFISNLEIERHKERKVDEARARLDKFSHEVNRLGLRKQFKRGESEILYSRFLAVNREVLRVLRFHDINELAMQKILKKFDKHTALGARDSFPTFVASNPFLASHMAKAICFTMSSKLLAVLPQLDDYLCPICQSISIKPVRLSCSHVFCVRCLVKLQREAKRFCPMCRSDVVLNADATNLDHGLLNFLRLYFPKEAKVKQKENEDEVVQEQWRNVQMRAAIAGPINADMGCVVM